MMETDDILLGTTGLGELELEDVTLTLAEVS